MSLFHTHEKCSCCNMALTVWNTSTCTHCGRKLCSHHAHLLRVPHSYVLASVCDACSQVVVTPIPPERLSSHHLAQAAKR